ncbi:hypothetical protein BHM03_00032188 [Ensete ventricosum]|nr:hypothetical protein BHM03_00032188 [Ensete ventricosum]
MASRATALAFVSAVAAALVAIILAPALCLTWSPWKWSRILADLVVMNATIYTSDPSLPFAQAMAIRGGRILRVGSYSSVEVFELYLPLEIYSVLCLLFVSAVDAGWSRVICD